MKLMVDVIIAPVPPAQVTALELLEDFADWAVDWSYLEEDSARYSELRGIPGCVIRALEDGLGAFVEFVFVSTSRGGHPGTRLALVVPSATHEPLTGNLRSEWIRRFVTTFRGYLASRPHRVKLMPIELEEHETAQA